MFLWCGSVFKGQNLPGGLQWGSASSKYLGVFLGTEEFKKKNWEGLLEKVCAKLSRWNWLLPPQLSYRGRGSYVTIWLLLHFGTE